jgi:hypothetical protein
MASIEGGRRAPVKSAFNFSVFFCGLAAAFAFSILFVFCHSANVIKDYVILKKTFKKMLDRNTRQ